MKRKILFMLTLAFMVSGLTLPNQTIAGLESNQTTTTIKLGGLFPLTGTLSAGGVERDAAARIAVAEVNADNTNFPDINIEMTVRDTGTDSTIAGPAATELISQGVHGLVGAASSGVSKTVAVIAAGSEIPQISYSSTNADLSDKTEYPYFLRVVPPDSQQGAAVAKIIYDEYGVTEIATLSTNDDYGSGGIGIVEDEFEALGGTILTSQQFTQGASDVLTQLQAIVDAFGTDATEKWIVLNVIVGDAQTVFAQAEDAGITPENGYQWFGTDGPTQDQVFTGEDNSVDAAVRDAMGGMLGTAPNTGTGAAYEAFLDLWENCYGSDSSEFAGCGDRTPNTYATFAYDAVLAFANAAQTMIDNGDDPTVGADLLDQLATQVFTGVTGEVRMDANYDRIGIYDLKNQRTGTFEDIGDYDAVNGLDTTTAPILAGDYKSPDSDKEDSPGFGFYLAIVTVSFVAIYRRKLRK
jgi:ABC-type branched-subunit amino acid transport system substrate-binding protein